MFSIAIDGPSGSGKSTAAKLLAKKLGCIYVDTGAMYRAVAYFCIENNVNLDSAESVEKAILNDINISLVFEDNMQKLSLNGAFVTELLRTQQVAEGSSKVASYDGVRKRLVEIQQNIAKTNSVIMDGRDIGTCVLKNASLKIYLDASVSVRTNRRISELSEKGVKADYEKTKEEIIKRDLRDKTREISPLKVAEDAIILNSDNMTIEQVVEFIEGLVKKCCIL